MSRNAEAMKPPEGFHMLMWRSDKIRGQYPSGTRVEVVPYQGPWSPVSAELVYEDDQPGEEIVLETGEVFDPTQWPSQYLIKFPDSE